MSESDEFKKAKARNWVSTLHMSEKYPDFAAREAQVRKYPDWVKHIRFGREHTQEGKPHLQCYVECWEPVRWTQFRSWIGDSFREPMYGRIVDNDNYCSKEGSYEDLGERPMQGRRTDLIGTKRRMDEIAPGESIYDIANEEPHHAQVAKYSRFYENYVAHHRMKRAKTDHSKPEVIYIYGKPGTGKDRYVDEQYPDAFDVPADDGYKWHNGYNLDRVVVYRNISPSAIKNPNQFLKELDRRVCQVATKGGFVPWKPQVILMTSIYSPELMARAFDQAEEFKRRLTSVKHLKGYINGVPEFYQE